MQQKNLSHKKIKVGPLPVVDHVLAHLGFNKLLERFIPNPRYADAITVLVKNMLVEPAALYRIPEWARQYELHLANRTPLKDDVLGRALDKLYVADRASLQTCLTLETIKRFDVDVSTIHNDSTSIKFFGTYKAQAPKAVQLKRGHSKDHRPDLKQMVYNLSITEDGAIPIHFKCHDGNKTDDTLHIETWLNLRGILGRSDFLYVADSKLCTAENMRKIDREGGRFVTIVPHTRKETQLFAEQCQNAEVRWEPLTRKESTRKKGNYDVYQLAEGFHQLSEGFRLYWYRSSEKRKRDEESRTQRLELTLEKLQELQGEMRRGPKSEAALLKAAKNICDRYKTSPLITLETKIQEKEIFKKTTVGKPNADATYRRIIKKVPYLIVKKNPENIARAESFDGIFPLTTNTKLDAKETLNTYKYQPFIEKRFSGIKSDYEIAPVFLKKNERIEALMFICYIADLVAAIIQRNLRNEMQKRNIPELKTLPEERSSATPTWEQIQRLFANHCKYEVRKDDNLLQEFREELTEQQNLVLKILGIDPSVYSD